MGTKTGDEKFGHALHDDLTLSAICKKIKQKESEGNRRVRLSRRAWKYRIDDDESEKEARMQRCAYVSRRTQLACKNYRPSSELTVEGFCEVHTNFFQQLAQHAVAEQRRIERTLLNKPKDMCTIIDDETLMTVKDWTCAEQDLFNDLLLDDDDGDPLKNAEVWTDEEVIRCQLIALERKLSVTRDLRKLIAEKVRRLTVSYAKSMEEDQKKGKTEVEDSRLREIQFANRKYHSYHSAKDQYMLRRLKARLEWDGSEEHKLDYLKTDNVKDGAQCIFFISENNVIPNDKCHEAVTGSMSKTNEEPIGKNVDHDSHIIIQKLLNELCEQIEQALDSGRGLISVSPKNGNEVEMKEGHRCSSWTLPKLNHCVAHIYDDRRQHLFAPCTECGALGLGFGDGLNFCLQHIARRNQASLNTVEHWKTMTVQRGVVPVSNTSNIHNTLPIGQTQSDVKSGSKSLADSSTTATNIRGNFDEGNKNFPTKFVVIDERKDEKSGTDVKISVPKGAVRNSGDGLLHHGVTIHRSWQEEDLHSCARTRPFMTENFPKTKIRRTTETRYSLSDVRDYLGSNMLSPSMYRSQEQLSKSMVQDLLNGGPTRAAASASQFISRRMAAPTTTFSPKIGLRRPLYNTAISRSAIEAPEMISLGPTNNTSVASLSTNSTSVSSRPIIQRPIVLRNRTDASSSVSNQPVRLPSRCIATLSTSRPLPNWRNRSTISLDSRIRRPPMNLVLPMDYSNRPANAAASRIGPYFRRRDERQFISGNARSRLVAIDSLSYTAPRVQPRSSYPLPTFRQEISRPIVCRPRITAEPKAPSTAETLETAAAVASIAADLEAPMDKEDEADEIIGRLETSSWQTVKEPSVDQKLGSEQCGTAESIEKNKKRETVLSASGISNKRSAALLSRQSSNESTEDGLAVLAMAAASRAFVSDQSPPSKKSKYGQLGLEEEDDD